MSAATTAQEARETGTSALELRQLRVPFGDAPGLADISLALGSGERVAVIGPSGVGKTTLLRAVAGLVAIEDGRVLVAGRDVTTLRPERRGIVYLHQTPVLFPHLRVGENVAFPLRVRGARGDAVRRRVSEALAAVRLEGFAERSVHTLSGGQRHRVALARAIAARPAALLLDEPFATLDPMLRNDVRAAIADAQADYGPAMLLVSHDLEDAASLAHRVAVLLDGQIVQVATPGVLFARPATQAVERLLGIYQELPGRVREDGAIVCAVGVISPSCSGPTAPAAGSAVTVAFRAERVRLDADAEPPHGIRGRITEVRLRPRGSTVVVQLENGADGTLIEAVAGTLDMTRAVGREVTVSLDPCSVMIYPA